MNDACNPFRGTRRRCAVHGLLALLAVLGSGFLSAADKDAFATLKSAKMFAIGGVGFAGTITDEEKAFRTLLKEKDAAARFVELLGDANMEGQLYALLGLKTANPAEFERRLPGYLGSK